VDDRIAVVAVALAGLGAIHAVASGGTFTLRPGVLAAVGITPATTLSRGWLHLVAGLFHTTPLHIGFNLALFAAALPFAARGHSAWGTLGAAYLVGPAVVLAAHLLLVRPLAAAGMPYAVAAMDLPLVGFSVIAYATAGMAVAQAPAAWAVGLSCLVLAFELGAGLGRFTGPFIFAYHLLGFAAGALLRLGRSA
jgi:hypothetical protein